ncbi:MAG: hypothetical protein GX335_10225 [Firmicutes bacterium]|nr:hypothetical protein [Bacillota bacterium]
MPSKKAEKTLLVFLAAVLLVSGCWPQSIRIGFKGSSRGNKTNASFMYLSGTWGKTIKAEPDAAIVFDYALESKSGKLSAALYDSAGRILYTFSPNTSGRTEIFLKERGPCKLIIEAEKARGSYRFEWVSKKAG